VIDASTQHEVLDARTIASSRYRKGDIARDKQQCRLHPHGYRGTEARLRGSFWPHTAGVNRLHMESTISDAVFKDLQSRGHAVSQIKPFSITNCATAVLIDPASGNRIAGADPRRDCYAMAY
jgi:hypothetical protein